MAFASSIRRAAQRRTVAYPNSITAANTGGNTNYNSMQVSVEQRVRYGLTMLFNYTWSKALNNMPWNQAATSIGAGNSFVYPITVPNFKALGLRAGGLRPSQCDRDLSYVYTLTEGPQQTRPACCATS